MKKLATIAIAFGFAVIGIPPVQASTELRGSYPADVSAYQNSLLGDTSYISYPQIQPSQYVPAPTYQASLAQTSTSMPTYVNTNSSAVSCMGTCLFGNNRLQQNRSSSLVSSYCLSWWCPQGASGPYYGYSDAVPYVEPSPADIYYRYYGYNLNRTGYFGYYSNTTDPYAY